MSKFTAGWEIICPDGKSRHLPYRNLGDAECDARVISGEHGCTRARELVQGFSKGLSTPEQEAEYIDAQNKEREALAVQHGACPEGTHTVGPTTFDGSPRVSTELN
jgi:hypothetical protein